MEFSPSALTDCGGGGGGGDNNIGGDGGGVGDEQQDGWVSRQLVYGHFIYDTSSTDISSTMTFLAEIEAGMMNEYYINRSWINARNSF